MASTLPIALEELIFTIKKLPGFGPKSAQRIAFFLMNDKEGLTEHLANSLINAKTQVSFCKKCKNFSDEVLCAICQNPARTDTICVVKSCIDIIAMERTQEYHGRYFVLHSLLSPIDGIYPEDIGIPALKSLVLSDNIKEVILALQNSSEGELTSQFIKNELTGITHVSYLARGIPLGTELEYLDNQTLGIAFLNRK